LPEATVKEAKRLYGDNWIEGSAADLERYLSTGQAPTGRLRTLFNELKDLLKNIYRGIRNSLTPEKQKFFDNIFAGETRESATAETVPAARQIVCFFISFLLLKNFKFNL
jgi:hypothetical protein